MPTESKVIGRLGMMILTKNKQNITHRQQRANQDDARNNMRYFAEYS